MVVRSQPPGTERRPRRTRPRQIELTLAVGLALMLAVGAVVLTQAPPRVVRVGGPANEELAGTTSGARVCQANEVLPAGVSAIRLSLGAYLGAQVAITATSSDSRRLARGTRAPDWTGTSVTMPVTPLARASHVTICVDIGPTSEPIYFLGHKTIPGEAAILSSGQSLQGRLDFEYLASGEGSWWSRLLPVARHIGLGRSFSGTWVVLLIAALVVAIAALSMWLVLRAWQSGQRSASRSRSGRSLVVRSLRGIPRAAWICALIAFLNATAWSLIVPPFEGKDEADHFAYVEQIVENGTLPANGHENGAYSPEEDLVLRGVHYERVVRAPQTPAITSAAEQRTLMRDVHAGDSLQGSGEAGIATSEPPLYYVLQAIPYTLGRGNILAQLQLMRLLSALFGAATALLCFLFLRETLPGSPWAATIGALCVALQPLFAFMSGSVNPDAMLFAVSAAIFYCLARAFRRGLTRRLAIVLGTLIAIGFLTKLNFIGEAAGIFLGMVLLGVREARSRGRDTLPAFAVAVCIAISPAPLYFFRNALLHRPVLGVLSGLGTVLAPNSLWHELSYIWELYLPGLPGMTHYFVGMATYKDVWIDRSVGLYGWMDTVFPTWVDNVALVPAIALTLLCIRESLARRGSLRARRSELGAYAAIVVAVLAMIGGESYLSDAVGHSLAFGEPRYLLPLLPLLGAVVALAVRGAGQRWAAAAGAAFVLLFLGHDIFSQLQVIARYYG